jgi:hypothetical protein
MEAVTHGINFWKMAANGFMRDGGSSRLMAGWITSGMSSEAPTQMEIPNR